jgi:hypothetical protein
VTELDHQASELAAHPPRSQALPHEACGHERERRQVFDARAHEQQRAAAFMWAGAAAGLAAATKYPGALAMTLPLIAVWMAPGTRPSRTVGALAALGGGAAAFVLAAPYTVLDLPAFLNGYAHLASLYAPGLPAEPAWLTYLKHMRNNVQWPAFLLMTGGAVLAVVRGIRGPGRVRWTLAVVFPTLYLWFISRQAGIVYGRYLLPLLPFACILGATAVVSGVSLLRRFSIPRALRTALIVALTVVTLLPALVRSINFDRAILKRSTAALTYDWLVTNVPADADIVVECAELVLTKAAFRSQAVRQLRLQPHEYYVQKGVEYLVACSACYGGYLKSPHLHPKEYAE